MHSIAKPGPFTASDGALQPDTGLIVQFDGNRWRDETGSATDINGVPYDQRVRFTLPDYDVFVLNANGSPQVVDQISGVGTTLFNMISNPTSGNVYVTNTEALNVNRFEGQGRTTSTVRGNFAQSRITVLNAKTRFNNSIAVIDTTSLTRTTTVAMANPEPTHVVAGRKFLYNAREHSSHGDSSCALCHVSGDTDGLA